MKNIFISAAVACIAFVLMGASGVNISKNVYDVVADCGADPAAKSDSTKAFNDCIAGSLINGGPSAYAHSQVFVPPGLYCASTINLTAINGMVFRTNYGSSIIYGSEQTTPGPILDLTGSQSVYSDGIIVYGQVCGGGGAPPVVPTTGILLADSGNEGNSDYNQFNLVEVHGFFSHAALYMFASTDNAFYTSAFSTQSDSPTMYIGNVNAYSLTSPYATIRTGQGVSGDNSFFQSSFGNQNSSRSGGALIEFNGVQSTRFYGGTNGANNLYAARFSGTNYSVTFNGVGWNGQAGDAINMAPGSSLDALTVIANNFQSMSYGSLISGSGPVGPWFFGNTGTHVNNINTVGFH